MPYSYSPIAENHIRLLKPAGLDRSTRRTINTDLSFSVVTVPIASDHLYTAVSYAWGLGAACQEVRLDGYGFAIRQNLWSCLHYLMLLRTHPHHHTPWDYIWVDAICINQSNEKEKNQQVRAMDKVYSNAVEVSAWLGLQRLPHWFQWREQAAKTIESEDWTLRENIYDIAERPYWSRMWIVQELLLARQIRIHVSDASFGFDHLMEVIGDRQTSRTEDLRRVLAYTKSRELDQLDSPRHLHDLVLEFGTCQCHDPRDKVFALMSLVSQYDKLTLGRFLPDYSLTHDAVVAIALSHFREHHHLTITDMSHDIFDSLGVSQSRYIRRRLLAASDGLWLYDDPASMNGIDFREINFHELADDSAEAQAQDEQPEGAIEKTASRLWWFLTGCGLFQMERDPLEQAFLDFVNEARKHHRSRVDGPPERRT
jgi:hypothetical protein